MLYREIITRKKMYSRALAMFLLVFAAFMLPARPCMAEEDDNSVKASRKIISVVYDDSGSMYNSGSDKWAQANYAMQTFAALLNEQDRMFITYMSDARNIPDSKGGIIFEIGKEDAVELDIAHADQAVEEIRNRINMGKTPVQAVDAAMEKLRDIPEKEESTQYWLVILTDGMMFSGEDSQGYGTLSDVQEKLDSFKGEKMPNGSQVHITYLGIGQDAQELKGDPEEGFDAESTGDVVDSLSRIANKISGRMLFEDSAVSQIDDYTIRIHNDIPLYSVSAFTQRSNAQLKEIKGVEENRNIVVKYPESPDPGKIVTNTNLYGNAAMANRPDGSLIQAGDYVLVFTEKVSLKNTVLMYQPAIKMIPSVTRDGTKLKTEDLEKKLKEGDKINIELIPTNPETGEAIEESLLPQGISWSIDYSINDADKEHSDNRVLRNAVIENGDHKISCNMTIPDMAPQNDIYHFHINAPVVYGFEIKSDGDALYKRGKMGKDNCIGSPITINLTADGKSVSKKEQKKIEFEISDITLDDSEVKGSFFETWGIKMAKTGTGRLKDGSFTVYPQWTLLPFLVKPGQYHFTITTTLPDGSSYEEKAFYTVVGHWTDWLFLFVVLGIIALILYIVVGLIILKPKFHGERITVITYTSDGGKGGLAGQSKKEILRSFTRPGDFTPFASKRRIGKVTLVAASGYGIVIKKRNIQSFKKAGVSSLDAKKQYKKLVMGLSSSKEVKNDQYIGMSPYYLYDGYQLYEVCQVRK